MGQSDEMHNARNRMRNITEECLKANRIQNFTAEITPDGPKSEQAQCFYKCVMTSVGVVDEEGNFEKNRLSKSIDAVCQESKSCITSYNALVDECNKVTDDSKCGVVWKKMQCLKKFMAQNVGGE
ncbi:uncharacterized protein [Anabrus simplex]|uniref:uncharacterized protein n=1 Tax=Anabrus simplex TaxID=316456 RepID=UPI0035A2D524